MIGFQERVDFSPELLIAAARTGEENFALAELKLARGVKDLFYSLQRRRAHRMSLTEVNKGNEGVPLNSLRSLRCLLFKANPRLIAVQGVVSSLWSQALANSQSRRTVIAEMLRTSAISS